MIFSLNYFRTERISTVLDDIMSERIEIIENTAYGEHSYMHAEDLLSEIIDNPLLQSDIEFLKAIDQNPTELDLVRDIEIGKIEKVQTLDDTVTLWATILWTMEGPNGTYSELSTYAFEMLKDGNTYILCDYYPINYELK